MLTFPMIPMKVKKGNLEVSLRNDFGTGIWYFRNACFKYIFRDFVGKKLIYYFEIHMLSFFQDKTWQGSLLTITYKIKITTGLK